MAKQRIVHTSFWSDPFIQTLSPLEKYFYLYLLTNEHTELNGVYEITPKTISNETDLSLPDCLQFVSSLRQSGKIEYIDNFIILFNFAKHQKSNPSIAEGVRKANAKLPDKIKEIVQTGYRLGTDSPQSPLPVPVPVPVPLPIDSSIEESAPLKTSLSELSKKQEESTNVEQGTPQELPPAPPKTYGNPDVNKMLQALKAKLGIAAFADSSIERNIATHCVRLMGQIGVKEFTRRLDVISSDSFKRKNCNRIRYVYSEVKAFIEPKSDKTTVIS